VAAGAAAAHQGDPMGLCFKRMVFHYY